MFHFVVVVIVLKKICENDLQLNMDRDMSHSYNIMDTYANYYYYT